MIGHYLNQESLPNEIGSGKGKYYINIIFTSPGVYSLNKIGDRILEVSCLW